MKIDRPPAVAFSPASALVLFVVAALLLVGLFGRERASAPPREPAAGRIAPRALPPPDTFAIVIPPRYPADQLRDVARDACGERARCTVLGWTSEAEVARGWPLTDREAAALRFSYKVNRDSGFERSLWDCRIWPLAGRDECLATPETAPGD